MAMWRATPPPDAGRWKRPVARVQAALATARPARCDPALSLQEPKHRGCAVLELTVEALNFWRADAALGQLLLRKG
jgi:hypothetical protein